MASLVTLQQLRDQARARADMQNSGFIQNAELDFYINSEAQELYDLLTTKFEDYYISSSPFTVTAPATTFNLPSDFYKLRGVDIAVAPGQYTTARPFTFEERNRLQNPLLYPQYEQSAIFYRVRGTQMLFMGQLNGSVTGQIWYVPAMTKLVNASDTFDGINGWEEYIILGATIRMKLKEESDARIEIALKQEMKKRIEETAANRDVGTPDRVTDVTTTSIYPYWRF